MVPAKLVGFSTWWFAAIKLTLKLDIAIKKVNSAHMEISEPAGVAAVES